MNSRIICYTLFNITYTGITSRTKPNTEEIKDWTIKRNTQWNFDTILQVISLRSQPEIVTYPEKMKTKNLFGTIFQKQDRIYCWKFIFQVQHNSVFDNEVEKLAHLYNDCHNVPMILVGGENNLLSPILDTSPQQRNIFFDYE